MAEGRFGCIQEAFGGFLKCLGLESEGGNGAGSGEPPAVNDPPPPQPPINPTPPTTYAQSTESTTTDPLVEALTSPIDNTIVSSTRDVSIDEIMNTSGGTSGEAHYVDLHDNGKTNMSLLTTRLISSGGGGKNH